LSKVSVKHGTPVPAIWCTMIASLLAMAWTGAVPIVTSLSTVALYIAYIAPVILGLRARLKGHEWTKAAVWTLGRHGVWINVVAIVFTLGISIVLMMPPNELAGKTFAGLTAILVLLYLVEARRKYKGPPWIDSRK
jgi:amino acid transporter